MLRLLISIFICIYAGSIVSALLHHAQAGGAKPALIGAAGSGLLALGAALALIRLPLSRENITLRLGAAMACFYAGMLLGAVTGKMAGAQSPSVAHMIISAISFQGCAIVLVWLFLREHEAGWAASFGWDERPGRALLIGVGVGLAFLPIGWALQVVSAQLIEHMPLLRLKIDEQQSVQTLRMTSSAWHKAALAVTTVSLAPLAEEFLFRGVLFKWVSDAGFTRFAFWGLSVLFALIHLNAATFLPLFALSLTLTALYARTGNLLAPVAGHAIFNAANFLMLFLIQRSVNKPF